MAAVGAATPLCARHQRAHRQTAVDAAAPNSDAIDARTRKACGEVKNAGIKVHTVRVIEGNAKLLRDCATSATDTYHEVRNAAELGPVFRRIANDIAGIRLAF